MTTLSLSTILAHLEDTVEILKSTEQRDTFVRATARRFREILEKDAHAVRLSIALTKLEQGSEPDGDIVHALRDALRKAMAQCSALNTDRSACAERLMAYWESLLADESPASHSKDGQIAVSEGNSFSKPSKLGPKKFDVSRYIDGVKLTEKQREVYELRFEHQLSKTAIAKRMGIHRSTVDEHLALAGTKVDRHHGKASRQKASAARNQ
jgi:predicted DNA-binding protein (UPF0251 family)